MSNHLGVAATSACLQQLLTSGFANLKLDEALGHTPLVSCIAPERLDGAGATSTLNIFLYNQTRNSAWINQGLPVRDSRGERQSNPPMALDLHILLAAYGAADFHAEILLGSALQLLHDCPVLGRDQIRELLEPGPAKANLPAALALAGLADQLEQLRLTPLNHNTDEISRIWSALQTPARPSAAYLVSVVLMNLPQRSRRPLPVVARNLYAQPLRAPRIDRIEPVAPGQRTITVATPLRLSGVNLRASHWQLLVNGIDLRDAVTSSSDTELLFSLTLPGPAGVPAALRAGLCRVQLVHSLLMGDPPQPHAGQSSNLAALVLAPTASFALLPGMISEVVDGITLRSGRIRVQCQPRFDRRQQLRLLLNQQVADGLPAQQYSFDAADGNGLAVASTSGDQLDIDFVGVVSGRYLLRLEVDGAASALSMGSDGRFNGPELVL